MKLVPWAILILAFGQNISTVKSSLKSFLFEAGCKKKEWDDQGKHWDEHEKKNYNWIGKGKLLEKGACLEEDYRSWVVPEKGLTKVYTIIEDPFIRSVNKKVESISIDYTLTMRWIDKRIKSNLLLEDETNDDADEQYQEPRT